MCRGEPVWDDLMRRWGLWRENGAFTRALRAQRADSDSSLDLCFSFKCFAFSLICTAGFYLKLWLWAQQMFFIYFHKLRWYCATRVIRGFHPDSWAQWAALALLGPSDGSFGAASSVWAEVVSEPVLLSLVPSSMAPSGTLSLSSDAPSSLPVWASRSSEAFGFSELRRHKNNYEVKIIQRCFTARWLIWLCDYRINNRWNTRAERSTQVPNSSKTGQCIFTRNPLWKSEVILLSGTKLWTATFSHSFTFHFTNPPYSDR